MFEAIKELYLYRELLRNLVKRELRVRYKGSTLGFFWAFLNPILQLAIYSLVFSVIMRVQMPNYTGFLFVGLLPWLYFSTCTNVANGLILAHANIVKKIYFPRLVLPLATTTAGLINLILSFAVALPVLYLIGQNISFSIIVLPLLLVLQSFLVLGFVLLVSSINVYFRDVEHIWGILLQVWMYITPILYPVSFVPERYQLLLYCNPMTSFVLLYQQILYNGQIPSSELWLQSFVWASLLLTGGFFVFRRLERRFAEEI